MWLETKTWRQWGSGEYKTCCVGADGCGGGGGGGQPAACCEKNTIQLWNDIKWPDAKWYETIAYKYTVPFVVLDSGCSMESHLTLNLNDGTVFFATVSTIASELRGTFMLNSTEMFLYSTFESLFQYVAETGCGSPTDSTGSESNWPSLIGMGRYCLLDTLHWHVKGFSWIVWLQSHVYSRTTAKILVTTSLNAGLP